MARNHTSRVLAVTTVLSAVLLVTALIGWSVWHNHNGSSDAGCQICHLSHQTAAPELATNQIFAPDTVGTTSLPVDSIRIAVPSLLLNISRAPPAA
ncbi:MAG TPA: hypothetical protein VN774_02205 [Candidatus Limnocylindrales bacterium]|nr:hypothetical protein [Candidatus Limnocylindrales bacterium]